MKLNLINCTFKQNTAISAVNKLNTGKGGGIHFTCKTNSCYFNISNDCYFVDNIAQKAGGAHFFTYKQFIFNPTKIIYSNNTAVYGPNYGAYAVKIELVPIPDKTLYESYIKINGVTRRRILSKLIFNYM